MKKLLISLSVLCFSVLFVSCRKCKETPYPDFEHYFVGFKEGSYWIYRNEQNGDIDSVYSIKRDQYAEAARTKSFHQECASIQYISLSMGGFPFATTLETYIYYGLNRLTLTPENRTPRYLYSQVVDLKSTDTAQVNGVVYTDVLKMDCQCDIQAITDHQLTQLWYAKNIGLIQWQYTSYPKRETTTHKLIRYKITP